MSRFVLSIVQRPQRWPAYNRTGAFCFRASDTRSHNVNDLNRSMGSTVRASQRLHLSKGITHCGHHSETHPVHPGDLPERMLMAVLSDLLFKNMNYGRYQDAYLLAKQIGGKRRPVCREKIRKRERESGIQISEFQRAVWFVDHQTLSYYRASSVKMRDSRIPHPNWQIFSCDHIIDSLISRVVLEAVRRWWSANT